MKRYFILIIALIAILSLSCDNGMGISILNDETPIQNEETTSNDEGSNEEGNPTSNPITDPSTFRIFNYDVTFIGFENVDEMREYLYPILGFQFNWNRRQDLFELQNSGPSEESWDRGSNISKQLYSQDYYFAVGFWEGSILSNGSMSLGQRRTGYIIVDHIGYRTGCNTPVYRGVFQALPLNS